MKTRSHPKDCQCPRCLRIGVYTLEDFHRESQPSTLFRDVQAKINEEESHKLIDDSALRRDRLWSLFCNQVMGAEVIPAGDVT